jgi:uncharacterized protein (DUF427 family)
MSSNPSTSPQVRLRYRPTGEILAEGPSGWGITRVAGAYYVRARFLRRAAFAPTLVPGLCPYKGIYQWVQVRAGDGASLRGAAWRYVVPNPLLPFIWFRIAIDGSHPDIAVEDPALD